MSIEQVSVRTVVIPLERPPSFSNRTVLARHYVLVRVRSDAGPDGIGFCYAGHRGGSLVAAAVRELLAPLLIGESPQQVEVLWERMYRESLLHGRAGAVMRAISAVDIALWDHNARAAGLPLAALLGAPAQPEGLAAYASGGYYVDGKTPADLAAEVAGYVAAGFGAVKIKVGRGGLNDEVERVGEVRRAIGPDVVLMLDANNAWANVEEALPFLRRVEPFEPLWIEEPFLPDDVAAHAALVERTPILVATGELESGRWRFAELLHRRAAQVLQPDAAVCGGITEFRRIAALAAEAGVPIAPHWFDELHVHLVAASPGARYVEYFPDEAVLNFRRLLDGRLDVVNGRLLVPTGPGLGFGLDPAAVERFAVDAWH